MKESHRHDPPLAPKAETPGSKKWKNLKDRKKQLEEEAKALEIEKQEIEVLRTRIEQKKGLQESSKTQKSEKQDAELAEQNEQNEGLKESQIPVVASSDSLADSLAIGLPESPAAGTAPTFTKVRLESWCSGNWRTLCNKPIDHQHLMSQTHLKRMDRLMRKHGYRGP